MTASALPHSASETGRHNNPHGLRELATQLYALLSSGQHGLAFAIGTGGPALIMRETGHGERDAGREGDAFPPDGLSRNAPSTDKVGSIRVLRRVGEVPKWERAKELLPGGGERDQKFNPWILEKHLLGDYAVAPTAGGWVQWVAIDIDAHQRKGESEFEARARATRVLGSVWRALNCSATRHPLLLRSPGGGYYLWLPLTRGSASANDEHTVPSDMVRKCVEWHLRQAGLELGPGDIEVFPSGVGLRAPCGRGTVLLQARQPDDPDALALTAWPGTATEQVDWFRDEPIRWSRRIQPTVRAFLEQWSLQRRTLADWLNRPELEWDRQWGPLGFRDGHNDIPRWREIFCGEKNPAQDAQDRSRSQQSGDGTSGARGLSSGVGGEGKGGARGSGKGRPSGSSIKKKNQSPSAPDLNLSPDSSGEKLVYGRAFREKYTRLLQVGITQPSTRRDSVFVLAFYWAATCGLPHDETLKRLEQWCREHPHEGARHHKKPRVFLAECLREARSYLKLNAPHWPFRGGGHAGGLVTLAPADRAVTAAVDPRVALEVGALLSWLAGHADANGRVLDPVQISHGLLRRLCGDRRIDIDDDGRRHRVATVVLTELERLGVLTLASNYQVGRRGRVWSCWYRFGSGELPRGVVLPAAKWDQIAPFTTEPRVPAPALLQIVDSKPLELTSGPLVEVRVLGERVVPEGLLSVLSNCARGLPRALLTCAPGVERPTADPGARPPWFERSYRLLELTPRRLWHTDAGAVGPDIEELRTLSRSARLDLGGGGRDARVLVPSSTANTNAPSVGSEALSGMAPVNANAPSVGAKGPSEPAVASDVMSTDVNTNATSVAGDASDSRAQAPDAMAAGLWASVSTADALVLTSPVRAAADSMAAGGGVSALRVGGDAPIAVDASGADTSVNGPNSAVVSAVTTAEEVPGLAEPTSGSSQQVSAGVETAALRAEVAAGTDAAFAANLDPDLLEVLGPLWKAVRERGS